MKISKICKSLTLKNSMRYPEMSILDLAIAETAAVLNSNNIGKRIIYYNPQTGKYSPGYGILKDLNVDVYVCSRSSCGAANVKTEYIAQKHAK